MRIMPEAAADVVAPTWTKSTGIVVPEAFRLIHAVPADAGGKLAAPGPWLAEVAYRIFERMSALLLLVTLSPVLLLEAIVIRLNTPGPALFHQPRVARSVAVRGRDLQGQSRLLPPPGGFEPQTLYLVAQTFPFLKFRTMYHDARQRWPELYQYKFDSATFRDRVFKTDLDPRVTPLGLYLRRLTLDELPNLWCVVTGTMRLVGPRPELPEVPQNYSPDEMYKFAVKPGITGLAQISGRGLLNWGETLTQDLEYVRTRSIALDIKILVLTLWYVMVRRGAF